MKKIGIIPARMGSSRFPGKPMKDILGKPMIEHCYLRAKLSSSLDEVYVATCDEVIFDHIKGIGGNVVMTSSSHERASDRAYEALVQIEKSTSMNYDLVVMIQGDEPMIRPQMIDLAVKPYENPYFTDVVNLYSKIENIESFEDPNEIKVVIDKNSNAIYFSREPIPSRSKYNLEIPMYKQVCIIPFLKPFLKLFNDLAPTKLEEIESIDMLRLIENGHNVHMVFTECESYSVDTQNDLDFVIDKLKNDDLIGTY
jgi:3-deoxy-manno-octulosonate cytidylyltransferase (CMP-KDO synthetase)